MNSRQSMAVGGAAVVVATLAVASAVAVGNAVALNDAPGHTLADGAIVLPAAGQHDQGVPRLAAPVTVSAPSPVLMSHSVSRSDGTGVSDTSPTQSTARGSTAAAPSTGNSAVGSGTKPGTGAARSGSAAGKRHDTSGVTHKQQHATGHRATHGNQPYVAAPRIASSGTIKTPAIAAGDESGMKESPSSAGSKKNNRRAPQTRAIDG